ncbi:hypothetical protein QBC32DRAFT_80510 [Pseudoneurospora amorphoporcata]|uniref:Uncharacterized protein n=1 Tax=Pseudoneurospora amorphoporcata TaxID=241081 RepID=A0AAN6SBK1_9PEZI|nr:hypothetical protein QBC32DRAFT_80510 [Pseudoneurospora amorphoporcata]
MLPRGYVMSCRVHRPFGPWVETLGARRAFWNYYDLEQLADAKKGQVVHEGDFIKCAEEYFTPYYQPLIPCVNRLRKAVFPNGGRWEKEDEGLYSRMRRILKEA